MELSTKIPSFQPVAKNQRVTVVDALRGLALLGIILANVPYDTYTAEGANPEWFLHSPVLDSWLQMGFELFIDKKFITIFSLLFGFGFYIQYSRAKEKGVDFRPYFVRRMLLLLLIGAIHAYVFWWGDIIRYYVIGGLFLLMIYNLSHKRILRLALCFSVLITGIVYILNSALDLQVYDYDYGIVRQLYLTESYSTYFMINATIDSMVNFVQDSPLILVFTFGNMLLGFWLGKIGFFHHPGKFRGMIRKWIGFGATLGIATSAAFWALNHGKLELTLPLIGLIFVIVGGMLLQSLFYIGAFIQLFGTPLGAKILSVFEPVGRMALTNYLVQTLFYLFCFYHWAPGFGLYGNIGVAPTFILAIAFFGLQVLFSRWWLGRHAQGPVEYVWKKISYQKTPTTNLQRMKLNRS